VHICDYFNCSDQWDEQYPNALLAELKSFLTIEQTAEVLQIIDKRKWRNDNH